MKKTDLLSNPRKRIVLGGFAFLFIMLGAAKFIGDSFILFIIAIIGILTITVLFIRYFSMTNKK